VETIIESYQHSLENICKANQVKSLFAFGSLVRNDLKSDSDIDLLVEIKEQDPFKYADFYFELKSNLEKLFGKTIDLLEFKCLNNPYLKKEIEDTKILLYSN
jgi:predicted nucleotidyltransferase